MYIPTGQVEGQLLPMVHAWFQPNWTVRTAGPVAGLTGEMQRTLSSVDPGLPFSGFYDMRDLMAKTLATQRIEVALLGTMAGLALLLSAVGIFALVANLVALRTREIGIRIALGATLRQVMLSVSSAGVRASVCGLALGIALCVGLLPVMRSVLYGISVYDARSAAAAVLTLLAVAMVAATVPVLRIVRIDPAKTLRED
jgi:ABC-type antimicrobial peptide transport system permease subunit